MYFCGVCGRFIHPWGSRWSSASIRLTSVTKCIHQDIWLLFVFETWWKAFSPSNPSNLTSTCFWNPSPWQQRQNFESLALAQNSCNCWHGYISIGFYDQLWETFICHMSILYRHHTIDGLITLLPIHPHLYQARFQYWRKWTMVDSTREFAVLLVTVFLLVADKNLNKPFDNICNSGIRKASCVVNCHIFTWKILNKWSFPLQTTFWKNQRVTVVTGWHRHASRIAVASPGKRAISTSVWQVIFTVSH